MFWWQWVIIVVIVLVVMIVKGRAISKVRSDETAEEKRDRLQEQYLYPASGIGLSGALLVLFIGLKLGNVIDWEWFWVISPSWIRLVSNMLTGLSDTGDGR